MKIDNFFAELKRRNIYKVAITYAVVAWPVMQVAATIVTAESPVPIEKEPRHRLKCENPFVRVFDVLIPPGDISLFHIHLHDGLSIRLTDARIRDEALDGTSEDSALKRGAISFAYRPSPLTHRVSNICDTPFRNIFVEILPSLRASAGDRSPTTVTGYTLVLENERMRILRLVLAPGQSIDGRTHALRGMRIAVSEGEIVTDVPGEKRRMVKFEPGEFEWREAGASYSLRNVGSAPFEAVEIELK